MSKIRNCLVAFIFLTYLGILKNSVFSQTMPDDFLPDAISTGFGGSLVVKVRDPSAIYWNPALLTSLKDRELFISINGPFEYNFIGITQFVPLYGTFGVALSRISTLTDNIDRGTFSWGRTLIKGISYGAKFDLAKQRDSWYATTGWGVFIGNPNVGSIDYRWHSFKNSTFLDRINFGLTVQNIPLSQKLFDTTARLGFSFLLPGNGLLLNTGYHIRKGENTSHLGLGLELNRNITLFTGITELDLDKWGVGLGYTHDNFIFHFTYCTKMENIQFTFTARLSEKPAKLAAPYYDRGYEYYKSQDYEYSKRELKKFLFFDLQEAGYKNARRLLALMEKRIARRKSMVDSLYTAAVQLLNQGGTQSVRGALIFIKILQLEPNHLKARMNLISLKPVIEEYVQSSLQDGIVAFESKDYPSAINDFRKVLLFRKHNEDALNYLAKIDKIYQDKSEELFFQGALSYQLKNYQEAKNIFEQALEYNPDNQEAQILLKRTYEIIEGKKQKIVALLKEGQALEQRNRYFNAIKKYEEIMLMDKENEEAKVRIAEIKRKQRRQRAVISKNREEVTVFLKQAEESFRNKDWSESLKKYSEVLKLDPQNSKAIQGKKDSELKMQIDTFLKLADAHLQNKEYFKAINFYKKVLELDPKNIKGREGHNRAKNEMDKLVEIHFSAGIDLYTQDKYKAAISEWEKALKYNPNHKGSSEYIKKAQNRINALKKLK